MAGGSQLSPKIRIRLRWVGRSEQGRPWLVAPSKPEDKDPPALVWPIGVGAITSFHLVDHVSICYLLHLLHVSLRPPSSQRPLGSFWVPERT